MREALIDEVGRLDETLGVLKSEADVIGNANRAKPEASLSLGTRL